MRRNLLLVGIGLIILLAFYAVKGFYLRQALPLTHTLPGCAKLRNPSERDLCWQKLVDITLAEKGLAGSLELISSLDKTETGFHNDCHLFVHTVGKEAYRLFRANKHFSLSPATTYCGYGFYHGFMQALLEKSHRPAEARTFCSTVAAQSGHEFEAACYHGVGHGAVEATYTKSEVQQTIDSALTVCKQASLTQLQFSQCATGVFMELANYLTNDDRGMKADTSSPMSICERQDESVKTECYEQITSVLMWASGWDFAKGVGYIVELPEEKYASAAMLTYAASSTHSNRDNVASEIVVCRRLNTLLHDACISGIAQRSISEGRLGAEYQDGMKVCTDFNLTDSEKRICYRQVLTQSALLYKADKIHRACSAVPAQYRTEACN